MITSKVSGHHRGPKHKLWNGYRVPSTKRTLCCDYFWSSNVVLHAFSVLYVYSKFRHHPHTWATFVPNFVSFAASIAEPAHREKLCTQSLNHPAPNFNNVLQMKLTTHLFGPLQIHTLQHCSTYF